MTDFAKENGKNVLTAEQKTKLTETFGEAFVTKLLDTFEANADEDLDPNASAIADLTAKLSLSEKAKLKAEQEKADLAKAKSDLEAEKAQLSTDLKSQKDMITILSAKPEDDPKGVTVPGADPNAWDDKNPHFLGGVDQPFMAIDNKHGYNKRAYSAIMFSKYGIEIPVAAATTLDYESLKTDLGAYYQVRKQNQIQSFLTKLSSVEKIFNLESGYQDQAVLVNLFMNEDFTQADNTSSDFDNVLKGGYKFEPEVITMYDVMFATKLKDLKKLEKTWIGDLNKEGSNTMKWSFIQYLLVKTGEKIHNEREIRRINGIRVNPTVNVAGTSLGASNGYRKFLKNQIDLFKIRPFTLGDLNETNISDYVRRGTALVPEVLRDSGNIVLYMSSSLVTAYHRNNETLYGVNQDYKANIMEVKEYPSVKIEVVPNLNESQRLVWTLKGNIVLLEDKTGEMYDFQLEQQDWSLKIWSNWKESLWAYMVGKKFASLADIPSDYSTQMIFTNDLDYPVDYYVPMADGDTTPSVSRHSSLVSVANTAATAITAIDDVAVGQEVRLKCGNATNAPSIAVAGVFSLLTAPWAPAVNDVLILKKRSDGKFIELARLTASSSLIGFAADDVTPSVLGGSDFVTNANTAATAITTLDDAVANKVYTIYGAGIAPNASTIANAGNFVLTAAVALIAGVWISLQKSAVDGKFYEISRG